MDHRRKLSLQDQDLMFSRRRALTDIKELDELGSRADQSGSEQSSSSQENVEGEDNTAGSTALHQAVLENNVELLKKLIENGADMNELDSEGWPPLHTAIRGGKTDCAAYLLKQGAGEFYYNKQKQEYMERLERSKKKTRKISYWR